MTQQIMNAAPPPAARETTFDIPVNLSLRDISCTFHALEMCPNWKCAASLSATIVGPRRVNRSARSASGGGPEGHVLCHARNKGLGWTVV